MGGIREGDPPVSPFASVRPSSGRPSRGRRRLAGYQTSTEVRVCREQPPRECALSARARTAEWDGRALISPPPGAICTPNRGCPLRKHRPPWVKRHDARIDGEVPLVPSDCTIPSALRGSLGVRLRGETLPSCFVEGGRGGGGASRVGSLWGRSPAMARNPGDPTLWNFA
jgi:hypothetical protein